MTKAKKLRPNKIRIFNGKRYERAGSAPSRNKTTLDDWADFQRKVNDRNVRIIREGGGWEAYISIKRRRQ